MKYFMTWFAKITGAIPYWIVFRPKVMFKDKKKQGTHIKGAAILISNHTSVYDFAVMLMVFLTRLLNYIMGEMLFKHNKLLSWFLRSMGGIEVNRANHEMSFLSKCTNILNKGGVVGAFPEARINTESDEIRPFTLSTALLAIKTGAPVIPVYISRRTRPMQRAYVMIGEPVYLRDYCGDRDPGIDKLTELSEILRQKVIGLKDELAARRNKKPFSDLQSKQSQGKE